MLALLAAALLSPTSLRPSGYEINPVDLREIKIRDQFWAPRIERNAKVTLYHELDELESSRRLENFRAACGDPGAKWSGLIFNDSDVYKVIEACGYSLELYPDPEIEKRCDTIIDLIGRTQEADGYLHTPHQAKARGQETPVHLTHWVDEDWDHELYCAGHMYEGAVAYYQATGKRKFLDIARKNADLVCKTFSATGDRNVSGHEEVEIGLVKMYRVTGDKKYLDEARWLIDQRGKPEGRRRLMGDYAQDDRPVIDQQHAEGHAVRASYLYTAMADVNALLKPPGYSAALDRFWTNVASSQIYVTGGIGSTGANEGFTTSFDLPNQTAYCETCASVANALWNQRMFQAEGDAKYIDVAERTLYNAFLSGVGEDGKTFFYPNVLLSKHGATRSPWFECACCPPNVARLFPTFATWLYGKSNDTLYVNYFASSDLNTRFGRTALNVSEDTNYPWDGVVKVSVNPAWPIKLNLALRIPGWAHGKPIATDLYKFADPVTGKVTLKVNGVDTPAKPDAKGYVVLNREWKKGDVVELNLPMEVQRVVADPRVKDDEGLYAAERGPIVYCAEAVDQSHPAEMRSLLYLGSKNSVIEPTTRYQTDLLGGVETIDLPTIEANGAPDVLAQLNLIPYEAWSNRGRSAMVVWLPKDGRYAVLPPKPTLASTAKITTSAGWGGEEMTDQTEAKSSIDHGHAYFHWWPRKGTHEWVQLDLKQPSEVSNVGIYWFQDEGMGECRLPAGWKVLVRENGQWVPVTNPSKYEIAKDKWCGVSFDKVLTDAIRIEVDLPQGFSTGIHQIKLN